MRILVPFLVSLLVSAPAVLPAAGAPSNPAPSAPDADSLDSAPSVADADSQRVITLHAGIAGRVYLGQPLKELLEHFPKARVVPFARQNDAAQVRIPDAGISCLATGPTQDELRVSSIGFNFDLFYEGVAAGDFRTLEGIGRGSTVEDLVRAYGPPSEVVRPKTTNPLVRRTTPDDPDAPMKHLYNNPDGTISTYFVVERGSVRRMSINDLAPLDRHILRRSPDSTAP